MGRNRTGDKGYLSEVCLGRLLSVLFSVSADKFPSPHPSTGDALGHQWGFQKGLVSGFPGGPVVGSPPANAGTWVQFLVREDPTCCEATRLTATTTEPEHPRARAPQQEKPSH